MAWCTKCRENRKLYIEGNCRRCYTKRINRRALDQLIKSFKPASTYNGELFSLFVSDFEKRHIKNADLPVAKRLCAYLEVHPIGIISSWADVYPLSDRAAIRYTNHATHGCPFDRIGRVLQKHKKITPRRDARIAQFRNIIAKYPDGIRETIHEFYQEVAAAHKRTSSAIKILRCVHAFFVVQGSAERFWAAGPADAESFLKSLHHYGVAAYTEHVRNLNRLYEWAKERGHCLENPFAGLKNPNLIRQCPQCNQQRIFWSCENLCDDCYRHGLLKKKIDVIASSVRLTWTYNQYLFDLYLKYINRYQIRSQHFRSTKLLIAFLKSRKLKVMRSWLDVAKARAAFLQFHNLEEVPEKGCPVEKIAYVLQELGVLPVREEDHEIYVESALASADPAFAALVREYQHDLKRQRRSQRALHGVFKMLHDYYLWLKENSKAELFTASEELARSYLLSRPTRDHSGVLRAVLAKFYRWAILKKRTLSNPFAGVESVKLQPSLEICSNDIIRKLERFIKRSTSDPESALILFLIFYFGFTAVDLAMANLDAPGEALVITLHRGELSYGHKIHKRAQVLKLPIEPEWLRQLQKRYLIFWRKRLSRIKRNFPLSPLLLRSDCRHGRPLRTLAVYDRVKVATQSAVGFEIPASVIRRTGAHVYTRQVDAAILTEFGWSRDYSFDFVWRQRRLYSPKQK